MKNLNTMQDKVLANYNKNHNNFILSITKFFLLPIYLFAALFAQQNIKVFAHNPKVSVIVPVYNSASYLDKCLSSIVNQTLRDIEIICINDGSTDRSLEILQRHAKTDQRIKLVNQENQGVAVARNIGMDMALGEYIGFVDSDDWIEPNTYELAYSSAKQNDADVVTWGFVDSKEKKTIPPFSGVLSGIDATKYYLCDDIEGYMWRQLYRKDMIEQNKIKYNCRIVGDQSFRIDVGFALKRLCLLPDILYHYSINSGSILHDRGIDSHFDFIDPIQTFTDHLIDNLAAHRDESKSIERAIKKSNIKSFTNLIQYRRSMNQDERAILETMKTYIQNSILTGSKACLLDQVICKVSDSWWSKTFPKIKHGREIVQKYFNMLPSQSKQKLRSYLSLREVPETFTPKVSVIIPVYNVEPYLERCLNSIINQTLYQIEIICINDGSTDHSLEILQRFAAQDQRIKIIDQENKGLSEARNAGMDIALGEYIGFVDSDDWIDNRTYQVAYNTAKQNDADAVIYGFIATDPLRGIPDKTFYIPKIAGLLTGLAATEYFLCEDTHGYCWRMLYRSEMLKQHGIRFEGRFMEDQLWRIDVGFTVERLCLIDRPFYFYFHSNPTSLSHLHHGADWHKTYVQSVTRHFSAHIGDPKFSYIHRKLCDAFKRRFKCEVI